MPSLSLRINLEPEGRIGPGKIALLEKIAAFGSISAGGRAMGMSYRRAWLLIEEINGIFGRPVVDPQIGGKHGGGATLTALGSELVARYRAAERAAEQAARTHLTALQKELSNTRPCAADSPLSMPAAAEQAAANGREARSLRRKARRAGSRH